MQIRGNLRSELVDTQFAKETVLYANSAAYLLNRLRKDSAVSYVARVLRTDEIIDDLAEFCAEAHKEPIDFVRAYVFLVALSLKDDLYSFRDRLLSIDMNVLEWGHQIRARIFGEPIPMTVTRIEMQKLQESQSETSLNRTTVSTGDSARK